ncbi:cytochrome P450 [Exidia glandulosa HHB12029]|uniref:Cytochrome P450 n=1 Tax=Exidia glandulosa HHB12029 TaxID=1314781 RepID=A0A165Q3F2_EXIGL|nr:cytochrome P450 [Exidia glandulosa HHB12029]
MSYFMLVALVIATILVAAVGRRRSRRRNLPPGPPQKFLVGNIHNAPRPPEEWKGFAALGERYGPVVHLRILTKDIIVLNSLKAVKDLLDKRSAIYSDRPEWPFANDIIGFDWTTTGMRYGNRVKLHRRTMHQFMSEAVAKSWRDIHRELNIQFLQRLSDAQDSGAWWDSTMWLTGANIVRLTYGFDAGPDNDPWIRLGMDTVDIAGKTGGFGAYLVDWIPALKYIPAWLPGAQFKRDGLSWRKIQERHVSEPYARTKHLVTAGEIRQCFVTEMMEGNLDLPDEEVRTVAAMMFLAGADTTLSAMRSFVHAMVLHPDTQRTAQAEIDRITQSSRLPTFLDRPNLPFVEAIVREVMRLYVVVPLALPHRLIQDDEYEGMYIPKGATIIPNTRAIMNDEQHYEKPGEFRPERFLRGNELDSTVLDPLEIAFGYGRRICPGRYIADSELWLMVATTLACFDISPAKDGHGNDIIPSSTMESGIISEGRRITTENPTTRKLTTHIHYNAAIQIPSAVVVAEIRTWASVHSPSSLPALLDVIQLAPIGGHPSDEDHEDQVPDLPYPYFILTGTVVSAAEKLADRSDTPFVLRAFPGGAVKHDEGVLILRITFETYLLEMRHTRLQRRQFPLAPAYATNFNGCQCVTLDALDPCSPFSRTVNCTLRSTLARRAS